MLFCSLLLNTPLSNYCGRNRWMSPTSCKMSRIIRPLFAASSCAHSVWFIWNRLYLKCDIKILGQCLIACMLKEKFQCVLHKSYSVYFSLFAVGKDGRGDGDGGGPVPRVSHVLRRRRPRVGERLVLRYTQSLG